MDISRDDKEKKRVVNEICDVLKKYHISFNPQFDYNDIRINIDIHINNVEYIICITSYMFMKGLYGKNIDVDMYINAKTSMFENIEDLEKTIVFLIYM